jgi:hypothetical protein
MLNVSGNVRAAVCCVGNKKLLIGTTKAGSLLIVDNTWVDVNRCVFSMLFPNFFQNPMH